jgi:hypothetical protein
VRRWRRGGKTVIHWIDRVQTRTFLAMRVRITARHPYIRRSRLGHAAAIPRELYFNYGKLAASNSGWPARELGGDRWMRLSKAQFTSTSAVGLRGDVQQAADQSESSLGGEKRRRAAVSGSTRTSMSVGQGDADAESGSFSQAARRGPSIERVLTMEPETALEVDKRQARTARF